MIAKQKYAATDRKFKLESPVLLDCPKCKHFVSARDLDLVHGMGRCSNCDHEFRIADVHGKDPHRRPEIIMPQGVDVLKLHSMLEIEVDWYRSSPKKHVQGLFGSAFIWNLIILPFVIFLAMSGELFILLLLSGHLIAGFALLWQLAATLINKTTIKVNEEGISIKHGPLRKLGKGNQQIPKQDIVQLYVNRYTEKIGKKSRQAYALSAILKGNKTVQLIKGMDLSTQLYLEQELETYLQIKDLPVRGEAPRSAAN